MHQKPAKKTTMEIEQNEPATPSSDHEEENLNDSTKIYRIYQFHDLINTIKDGHLRLTQASNMEDPNELFGISFDLINSSFGPMTQDGIRETINEFSKAQSNHYLSCWTLVKDNIAVWSLYSKNYSGILVESTVGKLKEAIQEHCKIHSFANAYNLEPDDPSDLFYPGTLGLVKYIDFESQYEFIKNKRIEFLDALAKIFREQKGETNKQIHLDNFKIAKEQTYGSDWKLLNSELYKDHRYQHEKEYRAILQLTRRDGRTKAEYEADPMAGLDDPARAPAPDKCPQNIYIPIPNNYFDNLEMDGRLVNWKQKALVKVFGDLGYEVTSNSAFGKITV